MAYYNVVLKRNSIKSKSSGGKSYIDLKNFQPSNNKPIGDDWDVEPGDVISWGDYRAADTYFVDDRHRLLENEDTSGSGYLTIPLSISRLFPSVLQHYDSLLTNESSLVSSIQLPPTDAIFVEKFGSPLPENVLNRNDIWYEYSPPETVLYVSVGKNEAHSFSIGETKTKDIVDYINVAKEKKCSFTVSYNIQGEDAYKRWPGYMKHGILPSGWSCQPAGTISDGHNYCRGTLKFEGPERSKETAYQAVKNYYDGFNVTIN